jgi:hypothetical protein
MTTWESFRDAIKEQYYPVKSYDDLYTKWTTLRQERDQAVPDFTNIFIPCAPRWVSRFESDIWCSSIATLCIDTSRPKWNFWTSHPWARPTDMPSKSSRSSNKRREIWAWEPLTTKAKKGWPQPIEQRTEKIWISIRTTSPSRKQRRTPERQRKIPGSGGLP